MKTATKTAATGLKIKASIKAAGLASLNHNRTMLG